MRVAGSQFPGNRPTANNAKNSFQMSRNSLQRFSSRSRDSAILCRFFITVTAVPDASSLSSRQWELPFPTRARLRLMGVHN
jgi:hypothetical protein